MENPVAGTLPAIIAAIGDVFEAGMTMAGTVATTVTGNPLLLLGVVVGFVGIGVGLFKRLLRV